MCIRWIQFSSVNPYARINDFEVLPLFEDTHRKAIENAFKLRAKLSLYIYTYMIKNYIFGGSFVRPMFVDFKSEKMISNLHELDTQFMLGSNLLVSPVLTFNERKKSTFFPTDRFYDFYTGELMNPEGEKIITVDAPLNKLPIFVREGFITPIQDDEVINISEMRKKPITLIVALDQDSRASGSIIIDDGFSDNLMTKRDYLQMDITCLQDVSTNNKKNFEIIFKKFENDYKLVEGEYPNINKIQIYGVGQKPNRISYLSKKKGENILKNYSGENISFNKEKKVLILNGIELVLEEENSFKITFSFDN